MADQPDAPRRKRKWDVPDPSAVISTTGSNMIAPPIPAGNVPFVNAPGAGLQSAQPPQQALTPEEAAARASALLAAKARPPPSAQQPHHLHAVNQSDYSAEMGINHVRADIRMHLTKGTTQDEIARETGASIVVKGVYCAPGEAPPPGEKPIFLLITADSNEKLESAKRKISEMIKSPSPMTSTGTLIWKVFVGIDNPDPGFGLIGKVLGPKGQYVKHIEQDARVRVQLRGRGAHREIGEPRVHDNEPTHLFIQASSGESLEKAKTLAQGLIDHVKSEYDKFIAAKNAPVPPHQPAPPRQPPPPSAPPPSAPRPPSAPHPASSTHTYSHHQQAPVAGPNQNAYAGYYGHPGYDYSAYYQYYGYQYDPAAVAAYYGQQQPQPDTSRAAPTPPPPADSQIDLTDSRSIKRQRDEMTGPESDHGSTKRAKVESSLVDYELEEAERKNLQKPFWAAPSNEPPPTAFIAPAEKSKDYDQLHEDLMRELNGK